MPKYQAEDFSIATAADGDNSARAVKSVAIKANKIKAARSGFTFFKLTFLQKQKAAMGLRTALPKPRANPKEASQVVKPR